MKTDLTLSVVIATFGRPLEVGAVLDDLMFQGISDMEIVVVDQSTGRAREETRAQTQRPRRVPVRYLSLDRANLPAARNVGIAATYGEVVLFLDDDVRLLAGCVRAHQKAYRNLRVGGVGGRILEQRVPPNSTTTCNRVDLGGRVRVNLAGEHPAVLRTLKGANMSYRREALEAVGGFDENYAGTAFLEDADLSTRVRRAGWDLRFEPRAALIHLSTPQGGVRPDSRRTGDIWRFHNTGYFVGQHRPSSHVLPVTLTFGAIAMKRSLGQGHPRMASSLMRALWTGWRTGRRRRHEDWRPRFA